MDPWNIPQITKGKPKDHNMPPVGLGNTMISTDHANKTPWTLPPMFVMCIYH